MKNIRLFLILIPFLLQAQGFTTLGLLMDDNAWTPLNVKSATLIGWYDFSDLATLSLSGGNITAVTEKSGLQGDANVTGTLPSIAGQNGLLVADFSADFITDASFTGFSSITDEYSVFVVAKYEATDGCLYELSDNTAANRSFNAFTFSNVLYLRTGLGNEATTVYSDVTDYHIFGFSHKPAERIIYIDGESKNTNSTSQNMTAVPTNITIGALAPTNSLLIDGKIGELIIYKGVISSTERTKIETYLNDKWAVY